MNTWKKIVNRGVSPELHFNVRNKVRIFNSSIFVIGCIYLFYTTVGFLKGDILAGVLTLIAYAISASCLYFTGIGRFTVAYHLTAIVGLLFLFCFALLYGEVSQTHVYLLFIPVAATVLFDDMRICYAYFTASIVSVISLKVIFLDHRPYYPPDDINRYLGIFNIVMTCALIFLAVRLFKSENRVYQKEISEQREQLADKNKDITDSIRYAKRIQDSLMPSDKYIEKAIGRLTKEKEKRA
ncbi:MAG: hypothetical protein AB1458_00165 [Bacteroidota bacterium]